VFPLFGLTIHALVVLLETVDDADILHSEGLVPILATQVWQSRGKIHRRGAVGEKRSQENTPKYSVKYPALVDRIVFQNYEFSGIWFVIFD